MQGQMVLDIREAVHGTVVNEIEGIIALLEKGKCKSDIRDAGSETIRQIDLVNARQERNYKFARRHVWCSRARGRRHRYF